MTETLDLFVDPPKAEAGPSLDLCARQIVVASLLYYRHDHSFMSDHDFDDMCRRVAGAWSGLDPVRQFMLGSPGEIRASGFHVKVTAFAENAAYAWMRQSRVQPSQVGRINNWTFEKKFNLHWAGVSS
ncbi:DNA ligase LigA-related protein [Bradyrhizobium sp. DASA03007]|uniref:DNA ligase LigA-related protein n=1 Tax=unclassified Bradyrhizobium TaxID=2631580 RepID=UPI003F702DBD